MALLLYTVPVGCFTHLTGKQIWPTPLSSENREGARTSGLERKRPPALVVTLCHQRARRESKNQWARDRERPPAPAVALCHQRARRESKNQWARERERDQLWLLPSAIREGGSKNQWTRDRERPALVVTLCHQREGARTSGLEIEG